MRRSGATDPPARHPVIGLAAAPTRGRRRERLCGRVGERLGRRIGIQRSCRDPSLRRRARTETLCLIARRNYRRRDFRATEAEPQTNCSARRTCDRRIEFTCRARAPNVPVDFRGCESICRHYGPALLAASRAPRCCAQYRRGRVRGALLFGGGARLPGPRELSAAGPSPAVIPAVTARFRGNRLDRLS